MIDIKENFSLKKFNTFGFDIQCRYFSTFSNETELKEILLLQKKLNIPLMVIGGGSNLLFKNDFNGFVIQSTNKNIEIKNETNEYVELRVGAGENWDEFVEYCVNNNWGGIENLSLIPGFVGTCPIQNIGAYGVEVKDVILLVETFDIETFSTHSFTNADCHFGYRDSIFKHDLKGKHIITHVSFKLNKKVDFILDYGHLKTELLKYKIIDLKNIRQAVIDIRNSKLPKPEDTGNAGSFFKNPVVKNELAEQLKQQYPDIPIYVQNAKESKIPAGWLIEKAGWKGRNIGNAGVHSKQALVLINLGNATGAEVLHLAKEIQNSVKNQFGIELEMEVNVV